VTRAGPVGACRRRAAAARTGGTSG